MARKKQPTTAVAMRAQKEIERDAPALLRADRLARFGEAETAILEQMDVINAQITAASVPANTKRAMLGGAEAWLRFCAEARIRRTTVEASSLQMFGTWLVTKGKQTKPGAPREGYAEATAKNRMTMALKWLRQVDGIRIDTDAVSAGTDGINNAVKLAEAAGTLAPGRGQAKHVTPGQVDAMVAATMGTRPADFRDRAMILVAFAIAARADELARMRVAHVDRRDRNAYVVHVKSGKTKASKREVTVERDESLGFLCPVAALDAWLNQLGGFGPVSPTDPLFPGIDSAGRVKGAMGAQSVRDALKRAGARAGISFSVTGHSVRAGFRTAAKAAGVDKSSTARIGGWDENSRSMAGYDRTDSADVLKAIRSKQREGNAA
jgi:integrase